ncbi:MAG: NifU family protein [Gemmatimonadaceae bacterium]
MPFRRTKKAASIEKKIETEIESLAPMLKIESSALRLERFDAAAKVVYIEISGDCPDCDAKAEMFVQGIEAHLRRRIPGIAGVRTTTRPR